MRAKYDKQLTALHDELIAMGALCEAAIQYAVQALRTRDTELAKRTMQGDKEIDQKERIIESACLKLLLEQQPVARDLCVNVRFASSVRCPQDGHGSGAHRRSRGGHCGCLAVFVRETELYRAGAD